MSCCICTDRQLSAVASYAARRCWLKATYLREYDSYECDHAEAFFRQLAWRNIEAFVTVYEDRHRPLRCPEWDGTAYRHDFAPMALLKAAMSIAYQLSDAPGWADSAEKDLLDCVIRNVACDLPGFQESPGWMSL